MWMPNPCRRVLLTMLVCAAVTLPAAAQTPLPFPRPGQKPAAPAPKPPVAPPTAAPAGQAPPAVPLTEPPTEASLGVPIYPGAEYIQSFDAGRGQRYYLFGTNAPFTEIVNYYRNVLKQKGELVYEEPPIHEFDIGRYREETMAFPPGVTVKDYAFGGALGYLNPKRGKQPDRFKTIIQIVPVPPV
jgi:hypothetical protein